MQTALFWCSIAVGQHGWKAALSQALSQTALLPDTLLLMLHSVPAQPGRLSLRWKVPPQSQTGAALYAQKSLPLIPDWSIHM